MEGLTGTLSWTEDQAYELDLVDADVLTLQLETVAAAAAAVREEEEMEQIPRRMKQGGRMVP